MSFSLAMGDRKGNTLEVKTPLPSVIEKLVYCRSILGAAEDGCVKASLTETGSLWFFRELLLFQPEGTIRFQLPLFWTAGGCSDRYWTCPLGRFNQVVDG